MPATIVRKIKAIHPNQIILEDGKTIALPTATDTITKGKRIKCQKGNLLTMVLKHEHVKRTQSVFSSGDIQYIWVDPVGIIFGSKNGF